VWEFIFFMQAKHIIGDFKVFFEGAKAFLPPNCPERSERQFRGKKRRGSLNKPRGIAYYACFARIQKITSKPLESAADWYFYVPVRA